MVRTFEGRQVVAGEHVSVVVAGGGPRQHRTFEPLSRLSFG